MYDPSDRKPIPFLRTRFREGIGRFSPDGRFIAYNSDESGAFEIYVRPFSPDNREDSASGPKWMVSKGGGIQPRWQADGKQLFYISELSQLQQMAVDVATDKTFQAGTPRRLFSGPALSSSSDATGDGKRFLIPTFEGSNTQMPYIVVLNWQAALKIGRRNPVGFGWLPLLHCLPPVVRKKYIQPFKIPHAAILSSLYS
jgi:hypothetical protein